LDRTDDYRALYDRLRLLRRPAFIGVEGFTGSGKSKLSNDLGRDLEAAVIHTDEYVLAGDESLPYPDRIDYGRITTAITLARSTHSLSIVEGICLREIFYRLSLSADLFVYIKRVASNGLWHDGFHLEDFEAGNGLEEDCEEPHRSDFAYHVAARPDEQADLLFERIETDN
jgi:hypothetical protein